jgi:protein SMG8
MSSHLAVCILLPIPNVNCVDSHDRSQLPLMEHSSGVRYISACNCGRKQGPREDPFTMRAANYDFYQLLGEECGCNNLESICFPVFQPSTQDYRYEPINIFISCVRECGGI